MPEKEAATVGKTVAAGGLSTSQNGAHPQYSTPSQVMLDELRTLADQAAVEPADLLSAKKVAAMVATIAGYQGIAREAALDALRSFLGYLPEAERRQINFYPLFEPPKQPEKIDEFLASCPPPPGAPKFSPKGLGDLLKLPPKEWMIEQVLGAGDVGMIYGPPGSGKTFVVIDLIFSACLGRQFARRFDVARPVQVALCVGEGLSGLPQRFAAAAEFYGVSDLPRFTFFDAAPQLYNASNDPYSATIGEFISEWRERQAAGSAGQLDLLIVDTLHSATVGADENSAQDMGKVLQALKTASRELGCAVLLVHHANKAGTGERGSSAMRGAMDLMIEVKTTAGKFALSCEKLKDGERWQPQTFSLTEKADSVRVWWDEAGELSGSAGKQSRDVEAIVTLLKSAGGKRYPASAVAEGIGLGGGKQIFKLLPKAQQAEPGIKVGLKYPEREQSPHNPFVYWFDGSSQ